MKSLRVVADFKECLKHRLWKEGRKMELMKERRQWEIERRWKRGKSAYLALLQESFLSLPRARFPNELCNNVAMPRASVFGFFSILCRLSLPLSLAHPLHFSLSLSCSVSLTVFLSLSSFVSICSYALLFTFFLSLF